MRREPLPAKQARSPRWLSVILLLAVLFLPLHLHVASPVSAQITKECACVHGLRTQADVGDTEVANPHAALQFELACTPPQRLDSQSVRQPSSRAPPYLLSL